MSFVAPQITDKSKEKSLSTVTTKSVTFIHIHHHGVSKCISRNTMSRSIEWMHHDYIWLIKVSVSYHLYAGMQGCGRYCLWPFQFLAFLGFSLCRFSLWSCIVVAVCHQLCLLMSWFRGLTNRFCWMEATAANALVSKELIIINQLMNMAVAQIEVLGDLWHLSQMEINEPYNLPTDVCHWKSVQ